MQTHAVVTRSLCIRRLHTMKHDLTAFDDAHTVAFRLGDQSTTWRGRGHLLRSE